MLKTNKKAEPPNIQIFGSPAIFSEKIAIFRPPLYYGTIGFFVNSFRL
jgi:hypothetical protein